jgi:hypothetical protein
VIRYLTGAATVGAEAIAFERNIGLMIQPGNSYHLKVGRYPFWAADNGAFTRSGRGFDEAKFRSMLAQEWLRDYAASCLFVVAPDKLVVLPSGDVVGDAEGTLEEFPRWAQEIRSWGFPVALVAQNGLESMLHRVPWELLDVLFIGGSTEWKLSEAAHACLAEARRRGKQTHMGRVNSLTRLSRAASMLVDTADGTFLMFAPERNLPRLLRWLDVVNRGVQMHMPWRAA